jgi:hypothetical protein
MCRIVGSRISVWMLRRIRSRWRCLRPIGIGRRCRRFSTTRCRSGRLVGRFDDRSRVWACYEAGPTGYDRYRLLVSLGLGGDVIAPSLVPERRGDHIKTDKRDARQLAGLHRTGQLNRSVFRLRPTRRCGTCAAPGATSSSITRARDRLTKFLLRHSLVWRDGANSTRRHWQ